MADKLTFEVGLNAAGFRTGIVALERMSESASIKMNAALNNPKIAGGSGLVSVSAALAAAERKAGRPAGTTVEEGAAIAAGLALNRNRIQTVEDQERELGRFKQYEQEKELARIKEVEQADIDAAKRMQSVAQTASLSAAYYPAFISNFSKQAAEAEAKKASRLANIAAVAVGGGFSNRLFGESSLFGGGTGPGGGPRGVLRETFVIVRELARHNFSRVAGSATLLAQYLGVLGVLIKSTAADSIRAAIAERVLARDMARTALAAEGKVRAAVREAKATGMSAEAIELHVAALRQEAATLLEASEAQKVKTASAIEDAEIESQTARISITALGGVLVAAVAVAAIAFFMYRQFRALAAAQKNAADLADITSNSYKNQAAALENSEKSTQAEIDRLKELAEAEKVVRDAIGETLEIMKERLQLEYKLAEARGASATELARMEIAGEQQQLDFLNKSNAALREKIELDKQEEKAASDRLAAFEKSTQATKLAAAKEKYDLTTEVMDAFKSAMLEHHAFGQVGVQVPSGKWVMTPQGLMPVPRSATSADIITINVGGKEYRDSLDHLKQVQDADAAVVKEITDKQKGLADSLGEKKKATDKDVSDLQKFQGEAQKMQDSLKLHAEFSPKIAAAEQTKQLGSSIGKSAGDSLVKVGNFLGSAKGTIDHIEQRKVGLLQAIERNTRPRQMPMHESSHYAIH